ncbi:MAG: LysM peptidoglycan-binding domain-containing protein [Clostridia bacterium]|nr:LysM peptidoglycan-binding domain-containing protein [Clostridia bacterium]
MIIHTVKQGQSVVMIAREYGVPVSRIITDNFLSDPGKLTVGEDLIIRFPSVSYTVKGGDTLFGIADAYGVTVNSLYRNNPFLNGSPAIVPGQVITVVGEDPLYNRQVSLNGYVYPFIDRTVLRRTLPYLTYLSIFTYGIRADGSLISPAGSDEELIRIAGEYGTIPLLMLTSLTDEGKFSNELVSRILNDTELGDRVIENIIEILESHSYGGIDVDFEYIGAEGKDAYVEFLKRLSEALDGRFLLFVSLAPKSRADQMGILYEGHDYRAIGEIADKTLVMTYEWGYTFGPPNAVSPIPEVKRVLDYAVSEIPRDKILSGIPNYGYDWPLPYVKGETKAQTLTNTEAVEQAYEKQAEIRYDEVKSAPNYNYYDRPTSFDDAVEHIVWFENARSCDALLRLINEYDIAGSGVWNIMNYFPALWLTANAQFNIKKAE